MAEAAPTRFWGGLLSTSRVAWRRAPPTVEDSRVVQSLVLSDGGTVSLSWFAAPGYSTSEPATILFLPGLNNSSYWPFVLHAVALLRQRNFTVAVLDYRATAGQSITSQRVFGADSWRDLPEVVAAVLARRPGDTLFGVGHSMGGSCMIKYLSVTGTNCPFKAVATISAPLALSKSMKRLESSLAWRLVNLATMSAARLQLYHMLMTDRKSRKYLKPVKWLALLRATTLRGLEAAVLCPMNGFADPEDYYSFAQADLSRIQRPTLVVHAKDDPVIACDEQPLRELRANPHIELLLTSEGGHLGYFHSDGSTRQLDDIVGKFLLRHHSSCTPQSRL